MMNTFSNALIYPIQNHAHYLPASNPGNLFRLLNNIKINHTAETTTTFDTNGIKYVI